MKELNDAAGGAAGLAAFAAAFETAFMDAVVTEFAVAFVAESWACECVRGLLGRFGVVKRLRTVLSGVHVDWVGFYVERKVRPCGLRL